MYPKATAQCEPRVIQELVAAARTSPRIGKRATALVPFHQQLAVGDRFGLVPPPMAVQKPMYDPRRITLLPSWIDDRLAIVGTINVRRKRSQYFRLMLDQEARNRVGPPRPTDHELVALCRNYEAGFPCAI